MSLYCNCYRPFKSIAHGHLMVSGPTVQKHAVVEQDNQRGEQLKHHFMGDRIVKVNHQESRTATKFHVQVRFTI